MGERRSLSRDFWERIVNDMGRVELAQYLEDSRADLGYQDFYDIILAIENKEYGP